MKNHLLQVCIASILVLLGAACQRQTASTTTPTAIPASPAPGMAAPAERVNPLPFDSTVVRGTLSNGLTYFILANERPLDRAELRLMVKAGSVLEADDQQGLAHFLEHMAFNGTKNYPENELIEYLQSTGARFGPDLNAYTSFDETVYMLQVRTDSANMLDKGLGILRDWAGDITFDPVEIDKERGVILSEWRSGLGAQERLRNKTLPVILGDTRYSKRLPIGDTSVIKHAPYEAITRYYRDWYRPNLMAVAVVGDIDPQVIEKRIQELFGDLNNPVNAPERVEFAGPSYEQTPVVIAQDPEATYTAIQVLQLLPELETKSEEDYKQSLAIALFNTMLRARLNELREDPGTPFTFAGAGRGGFIGNVDSYSSFAIPKPGKTLETLERLLLENRRVLLHGFTEAELARAKESLLDASRRELLQSATKVSEQHAAELVDAFIDEIPKLSAAQSNRLDEQMIPAISLASVNALARDFMVDRPRAISLTGPENEALPDEANLREVLRQAETAQVAAYSEEELADFKFPELNPVAVESVIRYDSIDAQIIQLANGVRIAYKKTDFSDNQILFSATSPGGSGMFEDSDYPSAFMVTAIGNAMGVGPYTPSDLAKKLAGKTVSLNAGVGGISERLSGRATPATLRDLMELIYMQFSGSQYQDNLAQSVMDQQRTFIQNLSLDPGSKLSKAINETLYGTDNPREQMIGPELLEQIDTRKAFELYKERFADASNWQFQFVGDFNPDSLLYLARLYLGNLPHSPASDEVRVPGYSRNKGTFTPRVKAGSAPRSNVVMLRVGPFEDSEMERRLFNAAVDVLSEELRDRLREDLGGVYGVRVRGNTDKLPREEYTISISFNADPPRVGELLSATNSVIDSLIRFGASAKTLNKVKTQQVEQLKTSFNNNNGFWLSLLDQSFIPGYDPNRVSPERYQNLLQQISQEDIGAALKKYWDQQAETKLEAVLDPES